VPLDRVLAALPEDVPKVGLIGAALTDYPWIKELSRALVERGQAFSYSSIRADRVDLELAELMRATSCVRPASPGKPGFAGSSSTR